MTVTLNPTERLVLHDALDTTLLSDGAADRDLVAAPRPAFLGFAVLAALDTIADNRVPEAGMIADARRVWGPLDGAHPAKRQVAPRQPSIG